MCYVYVSQSQVEEAADEKKGDSLIMMDFLFNKRSMWFISCIIIN